MTSPYKFFQFWINTEDGDVGRYLRMFTFHARAEIAAIEAEQARVMALRALVESDAGWRLMPIPDLAVPLQRLRVEGLAWTAQELLAGRHAHNIPGLGQEESDRLLRELIDFACQPPRIYHHDWTPGDAVVWDNRCTQHYAVADYRERRLMYRITIQGERPD